MPGTLTWDDAEKIGILLSRKHPQLYPLAADLKDLHGYIINLPEFGGDPKIFEEAKLEYPCSMEYGVPRSHAVTSRDASSSKT